MQKYTKNGHKQFLQKNKGSENSHCKKCEHFCFALSNLEIPSVAEG